MKRRVLAAALGAALGGGCIENPKPRTLAPEDNFSLGDGKLLVTYRGDDRVAFADHAGLTVDRLIQVGADPFLPDQPHEALLGPDGLSWFVTLQEGPRGWGQPADAGAPEGGCPPGYPHCAHQGTVPGAVERYRVADNAFLGRAEVGIGAAQIAITPDGAKMYVTSLDSRTPGCGKVAVVNPRTMTTIKTIPVPRAPHGIAITPDGKQVVVACTWDHVAVIQTATDTVQEIAVGPNAAGSCSEDTLAYIPNTVAVAPDGRRAYVSLSRVSSLVAIDLAASPPVLATDFNVRTSGGPQQVAVTPDGARIVVPCDGANRLDVVEIATRTVASMDLGRHPASVELPFGVAIHPDGKFAYVAAGCFDFRGANCLTIREGALLEVPLSTFPPPADPSLPALRKIRMGDGVFHVTFGARATP